MPCVLMRGGTGGPTTQTPRRTDRKGASPSTQPKFNSKKDRSLLDLTQRQSKALDQANNRNQDLAKRASKLATRVDLQRLAAEKAERITEDLTPFSDLAVKLLNVSLSVIWLQIKKRFCNVISVLYARAVHKDWYSLGLLCNISMVFFGFVYNCLV